MSLIDPQISGALSQMKEGIDDIGQVRRLALAPQRWSFPTNWGHAGFFLQSS